jgi:hypothetical protein
MSETRKSKLENRLPQRQKPAPSLAVRNAASKDKANAVSEPTTSFEFRGYN